MSVYVSMNYIFYELIFFQKITHIDEYLFLTNTSMFLSIFAREDPHNAHYYIFHFLKLFIRHPNLEKQNVSYFLYLFTLKKNLAFVLIAYEHSEEM